MKKIIAREFLFLLIATILYILTISVWKLLEKQAKSKGSDLETKIEKVNIEFSKNDTELRNTLNEAINLGASTKQLESIENLYIKKFEKEYQARFNRISPIQRELQITKESFFYKQIGYNEMIVLGIIFVSIIFGLRYLLYATKWSIKQIRQ